ncbi:YraN family protein [Halocynthiibacter namhaensis]|uniref:YraN family protein n=1 Tax=Halocynthiibacter namhaensis TaxID=1290553 RepID=UPI0005796E66|nr:YraN family protein [Halocynthiibacter namhaensis]
MGATSDHKTQKGLSAYYAGLAAEEQVARHYIRLGAKVLETRWRGEGGEIDVILRADDMLIFVEVKKSKNLLRAAEMIYPAQLARIMATAEEYVAKQGLCLDMRVDAALVDQIGRIEVIENITVDF